MAKKKTHEQFVKEVEEKYGDEYTILGQYINGVTKIFVKHNCSKCNNYEYEVRPNNLLQNRGCPKCRYIVNGERCRKLDEEYDKELFDKHNGKIIRLEKYVEANTNILHKCNVCENEWSGKPANLLSGRGCPVCSKKSQATKQTKLQDVYDEELNKIHYGNIIRIGNYIKTSVKILHKCNKCNHEWNVAPDRLLSGRGCPVCAIESAKQKTTKTDEQYEIDLFNKHKGKIIRLERYIKNSVKIKHKCINCGYEWNVTPASLLFGSGCPICAIESIKEKQSFTLNDIKEKLEDINNNIEILSDEYINASTKIKYRCKIDRCVWETTWNSIQQGSGCPQCSISKGERAITNYLNYNNVSYIPQKEFQGLIGVGSRNLSYDFYLSEYNLLIEYQGEYHDGTAGNQTIEEFEKQQEHDRRKRKYAEDNKINLLEIWYWDFDNVEKILNNTLEIHEVINKQINM